MVDECSVLISNITIKACTKFKSSSLTKMLKAMFLIKFV